MEKGGEEEEGGRLLNSSIRLALPVLQCFFLSSSSLCPSLSVPFAASLLPCSYRCRLSALCCFLAWHCFASGHFCDCHRHFHRCKYLHLHLLNLPGSPLPLLPPFSPDPSAFRQALVATATGSIFGYNFHVSRMWICLCVSACVCVCVCSAVVFLLK